MSTPRLLERAPSAIAALSLLSCGCELLSLSYLQDGDAAVQMDVAAQKDAGHADATSQKDAAGQTDSAHHKDTGTADTMIAHDSGHDAGKPDAWAYIVYYHFNGDTDDSSGNDAGGTLTGSASVDAAAGVNGKALSCANAGDGMTFPAGAFLPNTNSFSIAFWFRLTLPISDAGGGANQTLFDKGGEWDNSQDRNPGVGVGYWQVNSFLASFVNDTSPDGSVDFTSPSTITPTTSQTNFASDGHFHHVAIVLDRSMLTMVQYVDGTPYGGDAGVASLLAPSGLPLGSLSSGQAGRLCGEQDAVGGPPNQYVGSYELNGAIDEFMIVGKALSATDVAGLYGRYASQ